MVNEIKCPICGGKDFFPHEKKNQKFAKCVKCGKDHKEEDIYKATECEDGSCKL